MTLMHFLKMSDGIQQGIGWFLSMPEDGERTQRKTWSSSDDLDTMGHAQKREGSEI